MKTLLESLAGFLKPDVAEKAAKWIHLAGLVAKGREAIAEKTAEVLKPKGDAKRASPEKK